MFSQGGQPWTHTLVRQLPAGSNIVSWNSISRKDLPGRTFALHKIKFDQGSLSAYLDKDKQHAASQIKNIRASFESYLDQNSFLILKAFGKVAHSTGHPVTVTYTPLILIRQDTILVNPRVFSPSEERPGS